MYGDYEIVYFIIEIPVLCASRISRFAGVRVKWLYQNQKPWVTGYWNVGILGLAH
jgi:hypothetical protein